MSDLTKALERNWGAKAGQTIAGKLTRGTDGKFSGGAGGGSKAAAKPAPRVRSQRSTRAASARQAKAAERAKEKAAKEAEKQAKAEAKAKEKAAKEAEAKAKKGGGGGGGGGDEKTDDKATRALAQQQAKKEAARAKAKAARQQAQEQRQRQQAQAAQQQQRQQAQEQRRQQALAERTQRRAVMDAERQRRQQLGDQRRARLDAARTARQQATDARRAKLDAAREARQQASDARRAKLDAQRETDRAERQRRQQASDARQSRREAEREADRAARQRRQDADAPDAPDSDMLDTARAPARQVPTTKAADAADLAKALRAVDYHGFAAIAKRDDEQRLVEGIVSVETIDEQGGVWKGQFYDGDLVATEALTAALPDYMAWGNLREMHQPSAVGTVLKAWIEDGALRIIAKVVDDTAWEKVVTGVYKGFSIGGKCLDAILQKLGGKVARRITNLRLTEISLVDRPSNPEAVITLWKGADMDPTEDADALAKAAGGDPQKAIAFLQQLRDAAELAGDLMAADHYTLAISAVLEGAGIAAPHDEPDGDEDLVDHDEGAPADEDVAMVDGVELGEMPPDDAVVAMAARIGDIAKAGRAISGSNMAHLTAIHDAIMKMSGGSVCKGAGLDEPAAPPAGPIAMAAQPDDLAKAVDGATADLRATVATLTEKIAKLEAQPAPGGPIQRPVAIEKRLPDQQDPPPAKPAPQLRDRAELQRLALTEPNPALRADYARQLEQLDRPA